MDDPDSIPEPENGGEDMNTSTYELLPTLEMSEPEVHVEAEGEEENQRLENRRSSNPAILPVSSTMTDSLITPPAAAKRVQFRIPEDDERPSTSQEAAYGAQRSTRLTTDIGIYLDETSVMVGRFNSDINDVEILRHYCSELAFVGDKILIGPEAETHRQSRNHHYVYNLLKQKSSLLHSVEFPTGRHSISAKSIHASFYRQLGKEIMEVTRTVSLGRVVITVPFLINSAEKRRIAAALNDAGFLCPRILSSLLATGIAFAKDYSYFPNNHLETKELFVAQCLKTSFSMGIIEIYPGGISTKCCIASVNLPECRDGIFSSLNETLYNNGTLDRGKHEFMLKMYKKGVDQLCSDHSRFAGILIIKNGAKSTKLDCLFRDIFTENATTAPDIAQGPLLGASLVAAAANLQLPYLPPDVAVYDSSPSNLLYTLLNHRSRVVVQNQPYVPREVIRQEISVPKTGASLVLTEEYFEDGYSVEVCKYSIPNKSSERKDKCYDDVTVSVSVDQNGIYFVRAYPLQKVKSQSLKKSKKKSG